MKLQDILSIRIDEDGGKQKLERALSKTSWLEKFSDDTSKITLEKLESLYKSVSNKYPAKIGYIQPAGDDSMLCMIKNVESHSWIETIYFKSFWECMAKVIIVQYAYCIKGVKFKDRGDKHDN